jgi:cyanophycin synthetase
MATHRAQGKRCVFVDGDAIVGRGQLARVASAARHAHHARRHDRLPGRERDGRRGAAWGSGLDWDVIRRGLASFVNDADNAPGRFNVMDYRAPP